MSVQELSGLVEQLEEAAARLVHCHDKWFFGEVLPTIRRTNRYDGGEAAKMLAQIDAPAIADIIRKAVAYLDNLRSGQNG